MAKKEDIYTDPDWYEQHPGNTAGGGNAYPDSSEPAPTASPTTSATPSPTPDPTPNPNPNPNPSNYPDIPNPTDYPAPLVPGALQLPNPLKPWTESFHVPTMDDALKEPGFQFQLGEGLKALQRSAAARGTLLTGGTQKGLIAYGNDLANTNYKDVYNRAYNEYDTNRQNFLTNEANRYNSEFQNMNKEWGMDSDIFGMGRTNRMDSWGIGSDYFNMGQTDRMNDFNIWNTTDMNSFLKALQLAQLKKPPSPYGV